MSPKKESKDRTPDRITITLGPDQRKLLEEIAKQNNATLSFVIRYALTDFLEKHENKRLRLSF